MSLAARMRKDTPNNVGTLWTMRRADHVARCALMEHLGTWELRVVIDGEMLLAERCPAGARRLRSPTSGSAGCAATAGASRPLATGVSPFSSAPAHFCRPERPS